MSSIKYQCKDNDTFIRVLTKKGVPHKLLFYLVESPSRVMVISWDDITSAVQEQILETKDNGENNSL